jgi:monovalent cation/proton antiporter MnhG/PhaG subunit
MTPRVVASAALMVLGVGIELASCIGVLVMRDVYDKLHYTAPATTLGALAIAGAVLLRTPLVPFGVKALLVALALLVTNPVLTHAIARAARIRRYGAWTTQPDEEVERP